MLTAFISIQIFISVFIATQLFLNWNTIKFLLNNVSDIRLEFIQVYPIKNSDFYFSVNIQNREYSCMYLLKSNKKRYVIPTDAIYDNYVRVMIIETNGILDIEAIEAIEKISCKLLKIKKFILIFIHENEKIFANFNNFIDAEIYGYSDCKSCNDIEYKNSIIKDLLDYLGYKFEEDIENEESNLLLKKETKSEFLNLVNLVENQITLESKYYRISISPPLGYSKSVTEWYDLCIEKLFRKLNFGRFIIDRSIIYNPEDIKNNYYFIYYGKIYDGTNHFYDLYIRKSDGLIFISDINNDNELYYCIKLNELSTSREQYSLLSSDSNTTIEKNK